MNIVFLKKITLGSASWTDLGPILTPKKVPQRVPNWIPNRSRMGSKNDQEIRLVFDRFGIEKRGGTLGQRSNNYPSRSRGGGKGEA